MNYQEYDRPKVHFTPKKNWMNDPNGLVYFEGEYHLFFQYNPSSNNHDNMNWGHAVSKDLYHWEELDTAIKPDELGTIFSGSAVVDKNNTSGLFESGSGGIVAIFTHDGDSQQQSIAYSKDNGRTFIKYDGNPVIPNTEIVDFRDPKVFWHEDSEKWVMSLACGDHIQFFNSPNLIDWTYLSSFGKEYRSHIGVWECPDLLYLSVEGSHEKKWVLIISINDDGPNGGSAMYYFTGSFDGQSFQPDQSPEDDLKWVDEGKDFYAAVSWDNTDEKYWIGWMNNWQYAESVPVSPWRSAMSLVRRISIIEKDGCFLLKQTPVTNDTGKLEKEEDIHVTPESKAVYNIGNPSELNIQIQKDISDVWGVDFITDKEELLRLEIDPVNDQYILHRDTGRTEFSNDFPEKIKGSLNGFDGSQVTAVADTSSVELFFDNGVTVSTNLFYPEGVISRFEIWSKAEKLQVKALSFRTLHSIWN